MSTRRTSVHGRVLVALDASVLINFLILKRVAILAGLPGYHFVVLDAVEPRGSAARATGRPG